MKKLMIVVLSSLCLSAFAAEPAMQASAEDAGQMLPMRMEHMQKALGLSVDQKNRIETILQDQRQQMTDLRKATHEKINAVLTPEQQQKMQQQMEKRQAKMKKHMDKKEKRQKNRDHDHDHD